MNGFSLAICLLLPWLAGAVWMRLTLVSMAQVPGNRELRLALGFVLGLAATAMLLRTSANVLGLLSLWPVLLSLSILLVFGIWANRRFYRPGGDESTPTMPVKSYKTPTWLAALLLTLAIIHASFSLLEIVTTPLFPWDAWSVWVYRAKAWFLQDRLFEFVSLPTWWQTTDVVNYFHPGLNYPWLTSLVTLWAAMGWTEWHESLINVPVFLVALIIVLGVHGCLRCLETPGILCLAAIYLLLSTPMFATHMSLGGYADIWLAAYAGLGFVALMTASILGKRALGWVGMLLLLIGSLVKLEGTVWLLAALLWWVFTRWTGRQLLWLALSAIGACLGLIMLGDFELTLPGVGLFAVVDNRFHLPLLGWQRLVMNDVRSAYLNNAFVLGSWHLIWGLVLVTGVLARRSLSRAVWRPLVSFFAVVMLVQVVVFVFSGEGLWAKDFTAINRLPLQVYPAVVFGLILMLSSVWTHRKIPVAKAGSAGVAKTVLMAGSAAALICALAVIIWLSTSMRGESDPTRFELNSDSLSAVLGAMKVTEQGLAVERYQNGTVLLTSGPVNINADQVWLLELDLFIDPDTVFPDESPAFFWRTEGAAKQVRRVTLDGSSLVDLRASEQWSGTVTEVGFVFLESDRKSPLLMGVTLGQPDTIQLLRLVPSQWLEFEPWTQRSAHVREGGSSRQIIRLPLLLLAWLLLSILLIALVSRTGPRWEPIMLIMLAAWVVNDSQWLHNRYQQMKLSLPLLLHQTVAEREQASELGQFSSWLEDVKRQLAVDGPDKILIISDPKLHKYYGLRARYQLLPHSASVLSENIAQRFANSFDYVLFLGDFLPASSDPRRRTTLRERIEALPAGYIDRSGFELLEFAEQGMLYRAKSSPER